MIRVVCGIIFVFIISSCTSRQKTSEFKLKTISFEEAVNKELFPLQLTFGIPDNFVVRSSKHLSLGVLWGVEEEIEKVIKTQITETETGFFRLYVSTNTAYDNQTKQFTGEGQMKSSLQGIGAKNIKLERKFIGGYPALVSSADFKGKKLFSCFIATLNSSNVITILYYSPKKLTGSENKLWAEVIGSIKRIEYSEETVHGQNAADQIREILKAGQYKKFRVELVTKIEDNKALETPRIEQTFSADHSNGFVKAEYKWSSSNILKVENHTTDFSQPWNIPEMSMDIKKSGDEITVETSVKGQKHPARTVNIKVINKADESPIQYLSGFPFFTINSSDKIIGDVLELFDLKFTGKDKNSIQLEGTPRKNAFLAYIEKNNMPKDYNGVPFINELLKRFSKITVQADAGTKTLTSIKVSGKMNQFPVSTELKIFEEKN